VQGYAILRISMAYSPLDYYPIAYCPSIGGVSMAYSFPWILPPVDLPLDHCVYFPPLGETPLGSL
jgi:hypothetical protein